MYVNFNLVWAAKLSTVPVQMAVSDFGGQKGLVVTLDETGRLSIGFMGTKPPLSAVPSLTSANAREVDYDRLDEEHRDLLQVEEDNTPYLLLFTSLPFPSSLFPSLPYPSLSFPSNTFPTLLFSSHPSPFLCFHLHSNKHVACTNLLSFFYTSFPSRNLSLI